MKKVAYMQSSLLPLVSGGTSGGGGTLKITGEVRASATLVTVFNRSRRLTERPLTWFGVVKVAAPAPLPPRAWRLSDVAEPFLRR